MVKTSRSSARKDRGVKSPRKVTNSRTLESGADHVSLAAAAALPPPSGEKTRVNVDFTVEMLAAIDTAAARLGVPRQSFIKMRFADLLGLEKR